MRFILGLLFLSSISYAADPVVETAIPHIQEVQETDPSPTSEQDPTSIVRDIELFASSWAPNQFQIESKLPTHGEFSRSIPRIGVGIGFYPLFVASVSILSIERKSWVGSGTRFGEPVYIGVFEPSIRWIPKFLTWRWGNPYLAAGPSFAYGLQRDSTLYEIAQPWMIFFHAAAGITVFHKQIGLTARVYQSFGTLYGSRADSTPAIEGGLQYLL